MPDAPRCPLCCDHGIPRDGGHWCGWCGEWATALTGRELGEHLRGLASQRTGHDPALISIHMPCRDCPRHTPPPVEFTPRVAPG